MDKDEFRTIARRLFPGLTYHGLASTLTNYLPYAESYIFGMLKGTKNIPYVNAQLMRSLLIQRFGHETTQSRPVILGICDYYSEDRHHVYFPNRGMGATFWNLLAEKGVSQSDYLRAFDRRQLTERWKNERETRRRAKLAAPAMWKSLKGRHVMIVDRSAATILNARSTHSFRWEKKDGVWYFLLPLRTQSYSNVWTKEHYMLALGQRLETLYLGYLSGP